MKMTSELANSCWNTLCLLTQAIKGFEQTVDFCSIRFGAEEAVQINSFLDPHPDSSTVTLVLNPDEELLSGLSKRKDTCLQLSDLIYVSKVVPVSLPQEVGQLIRIYAPYCFASLHAKRWKRTFSVSHFAQSLDGRIATSSGDSRWIGSPGNFLHAHRMRSLCDGILIGSRTLKRDRPQLTVRHVSGQNPIRIVVGSSVDVVDCLTEASTDPVIVIGTDIESRSKTVRTLKLRRKGGLIPTSVILKRLYDMGIHSVYIEGGSLTTSRFLREHNLDVLQLHIAPMMIGSGLSSLLLPPIESISASVRFTSHLYAPVDDGIMFIGAPQQP
jgi:riboflavin-specific deaminase-like protein